MIQQRMSSDGDNNYAARLRESLKDIHSKIIEEEERLDLLKSLQKRKICTRDIMAFVEQQGIKRSVNKAWDFGTSQRAMSSKIRDAKKSLHFNRRRKSMLKKEYIGLVNNRASKVKKLFRDIKKTIESALNVKRKRKAYLEKIAHLQKVMGEKIHVANPSASQATKVPERLKEYKDLPVFGTSKDLPAPQAPTGPFICDKGIKLTKQELTVLSKDPKFSLMEECTEDIFKLEMERSFAKNRFNNYQNDTSNRVKIGAQLTEKGGREIEQHKKIVHKDLATLKKEQWAEVSHRYIYDPFLKSIDFSHRRPTDYKFNARIKLPKPMDSESEFTCELKRREYLKTYKSYIEGKHKKRKKEAKGKKNKQYFELK